MNFVESLNLLHVSAKEIPCLTGKGAPTERTEGVPGVLYMDTDTGDLYKCRGGEKDLYRWEMQGGGTAPVKGVDYYTEADKAELVAMVLEALGGNVISGYVDEDNNIIINGLPDGSYTVRYEMADGSTIEIGDLVLGEDEPDTSYTNLADPTSPEWMDNHRISSSGVVEESNGATLVNTIDVDTEGVVRIKGMTGVVTGLYKNGTWFARKTVNETNFNDANFVSDGDYTQFRPGKACTDLSAIRFYGTLSGTAADVIVTVNEEIV